MRQWEVSLILSARSAVRAHVDLAGDSGVKIEKVVQVHAVQMVSWLRTLNAGNHLAIGRQMPRSHLCATLLVLPLVELPIRRDSDVAPPPGKLLLHVSVSRVGVNSVSACTTFNTAVLFLYLANILLCTAVCVEGKIARNGRGGVGTVVLMKSTRPTYNAVLRRV